MSKLGTVASVVSGMAFVATDADPTTSMPVDVFVPAGAPVAGDRVLYEVVGGLLVVTASITRPLRAATGSFTLQCTTAGTTVNTTVPFPSGLFTKTPGLTLGNSGAYSSSTMQGVWVSGVGPTGFTASLNRNDTTAVSVRWTAVQSG